MWDSFPLQWTSLIKPSTDSTIDVKKHSNVSWVKDRWIQFPSCRKCNYFLYLHLSNFSLTEEKVWCLAFVFSCFLEASKCFGNPSSLQRTFASSSSQESPHTGIPCITTYPLLQRDSSKEKVKWSLLDGPIAPTRQIWPYPGMSLQKQFGSSVHGAPE